MRADSAVGITICANGVPAVGGTGSPGGTHGVHSLRAASNEKSKSEPSNAGSVTTPGSAPSMCGGVFPALLTEHNSASLAHTRARATASRGPPSAQSAAKVARPEMALGAISRCGTEGFVPKGRPLEPARIAWASVDGSEAAAVRSEFCRSSVSIRDARRDCCREDASELSALLVASSTAASSSRAVSSAAAAAAASASSSADRCGRSSASISARNEVTSVSSELLISALLALSATASSGGSSASAQRSRSGALSASTFGRRPSHERTRARQPRFSASKKTMPVRETVAGEAAARSAASKMREIPSGSRITSPEARQSRLESSSAVFIDSIHNASTGPSNTSQPRHGGGCRYTASASVASAARRAPSTRPRISSATTPSVHSREAVSNAP
mmetsp:Transcript_19744/g.46527  ORF Transcript_19744/g.46527 Transcript_19744/m.46527 type:complete len:390 (+) Transcript_19744:1015-2184(+)